MLQLYLQSCIFSTERTKGQLCMWQETKSWLRAEYDFSPFQLWLCQSGANIVHRFSTVENRCQASWLFIAIYCSREFIYFFSLWWLFINGIVSQDFRACKGLMDGSLVFLWRFFISFFFLFQWKFNFVSIFLKSNK